MLYRLLVLIHLAGVVAFFSNAVAALFWKARATRTREVAIVAHTFRTLAAADRWITPAAIAAIAGGGVGAAVVVGLPILRTGWIFWSIVAFLGSGIVFATRVLPLQRRLADWATISADPGTFDWDRYYAEARRWSHWTHLSLFMALVAMTLMVLKPGLAGL